jgi:PAS domain S-box-containing protein
LNGAPSSETGCGPIEAQLHGRLRLQAAVIAFSQRALDNVGLSELMSEAAAAVARTLEVEYCGILELLPGGSELLLRAGTGWKDGLVGQARVGSGKHSQSGYTLLTGAPVIVEDMAAETRFAVPPLVREHGIVSGMSVPVRGRVGPLCCLCAHTCSRRSFTGDDVYFLQCIGSTLAAAVEHDQSETALRESEARYRSIVETAQEGICVIDARDVIAYVNQRMAELLGYPQDEMLGRSILDFVHPDARADALQSLQRRKQGIREQHDMRLRRKDGSELWVLAAASPILGEHGEPQGSLYMVNDITERKQVEQQFQMSLKEKELLVKEVHHRVKNNLQVICSLLDLQTGYVKDPQAAQMFRDSQNRIRSIALVHEQLYRSRDFTHIDFGGHIRTLVSQLFRSYQVSADAVRLIVEVAEVPLAVDTAILIGLVISELVSNSLRYGFPDGRRGEVRVSVSEDREKRLQIVVSDNGIGLPESIDFRRAQSLGLQLVSLLSDQLKATVELERAGGTTFKLLLPAS